MFWVLCRSFWKCKLYSQYIGGQFVDFFVVFDLVLINFYDEGWYCIFIDIECIKGYFFKVIWNKLDGIKQEIIVWCGNDYLGMGQYLVVFEVMYEVFDVMGVGFGGIWNIFGIIVYYKWFEVELVDFY